MKPDDIINLIRVRSVSTTMHDSFLLRILDIDSVLYSVYIYGRCCDIVNNETGRVLSLNSKSKYHHFNDTDLDLIKVVVDFLRVNHVFADFPEWCHES